MQIHHSQFHFAGTDQLVAKLMIFPGMMNVGLRAARSASIRGSSSSGAPPHFTGYVAPAWTGIASPSSTGIAGPSTYRSRRTGGDTWHASLARVSHRRHITLLRLIKSAPGLVGSPEGGFLITVTHRDGCHVLETLFHWDRNGQLFGEEGSLWPTVSVSSLSASIVGYVSARPLSVPQAENPNTVLFSSGLSGTVLFSGTFMRSNHAHSRKTKDGNRCRVVVLSPAVVAETGRVSVHSGSAVTELQAGFFW